MDAAARYRKERDQNYEVEHQISVTISVRRFSLINETANRTTHTLGPRDIYLAGTITEESSDPADVGLDTTVYVDFDADRAGLASIERANKSTYHMRLALDPSEIGAMVSACQMGTLTVVGTTWRPIGKSASDERIQTVHFISKV